MTARRSGRNPARRVTRQTALLEAARDLFIRHGYRGTTLEAIIARAGGSRRTIYSFYGGKSGLFGAIIANVGRTLAASIVTPSALEMPPREALTRLGMQLATIWHSEEGRAINRTVLSEGLNSPELVDAWTRGGTSLSITALACYLAAQQRAGRLLPLDPELVARQFVTLLIGEFGYPVIMQAPDPAGMSVQVERCVELILRAYGRGAAGS